MALAYRFIIKRERTVREVRSRLARSDCPPDEIDAAVSELLELGYLDDARYASLFIADKRALESWGTARIVNGLRERGVAEELIERALAESSSAPADAANVAGAVGSAVAGASSDESEHDRALTILDRRFPDGIDGDRDYRRAFAMLARKGYSSEVASDAIRAHRRRESV